jgi:hypothetical protein
VGGVRSRAVSSSEPFSLVHLLFDLFDLLRLLLRAGFWGVVSPPRIRASGTESRDDCDVNSESDSVVEDPELAVTFACVCAGAIGKRPGRFAVAGCEVAPLFGDAG